MVFARGCGRRQGRKYWQSGGCANARRCLHEVRGAANYLSGHGIMARLVTLKNRRDFLRLKSGARWVTPAFVLQAAPRTEAVEAAEPRFGFTVSRHAVVPKGGPGRKRGNAVRRNRARRRLKEAVRHVAPLEARQNFDYVVIGRAGALERDFEALVTDMHEAFAKVHSRSQRTTRTARTQLDT